METNHFATTVLFSNVCFTFPTDYIAHEVRNPIVAAMSACSFVQSAIHDHHLSQDQLVVLQEDVDIIENSLHFVNDVLRGRLDLTKRTTSKADNDAQESDNDSLQSTDDHSHYLVPTESNLQLFSSFGSFENVSDCPDRTESIFSTEQSSTETLPFSASSSSRSLPKELSVLFVDDDLILRKLFVRSLQRAVPQWTVHQATCGEEALRRIVDDKEHYDVIFLDQYMSTSSSSSSNSEDGDHHHVYDNNNNNNNNNKQQQCLLGSETAALLRSKGVTSRLCGLSANTVQEEFFQAGADAFMSKPFPTQTQTLYQELTRILYGDKDEDDKDDESPPRT